MLKSSKGFTLIELMVVIAIIAILAGLVIVRIGSTSEDARNSTRAADMSQIRTAIERYRANGGAILGAFTVVDATVTNLEGTGKPFEIQDNNGNYPSAYLTGGVYPEDPQSNSTTPLYYQIVSTDGTNYTISVDPDAADDTSSVSDVQS